MTIIFSSLSSLAPSNLPKNDWKDFFDAVRHPDTTFDEEFLQRYVEDEGTFLAVYRG